MNGAQKRKHVLHRIQNKYCLPKENEQIVRTLKPLGGNLLSVETTDKEEFLVSIPHKFRQAIWVKCDEYILITRIKEGVKVKGEMVKKLTKDHIDYFKEENVWPMEFVAIEKEVVDNPYEFINANRNIIEMESYSSSEDDDDDDKADEDKSSEQSNHVDYNDYESDSDDSFNDEINNNNQLNEDMQAMYRVLRI